jgi:Phage Tail Collar Domain
VSEPFLSEIRIMSFNFAPKGWALCNGQLLPISHEQRIREVALHQPIPKPLTVLGADGPVFVVR